MYASERGPTATKGTLKGTVKNAHVYVMWYENVAN